MKDGTIKTKPRPRHEQIVEELAKQIRAGEIGANGKMPSERALMESFQVGRSTVREALFALRKLGLVSVRNGAVAEVREPTPAVLINELSVLAKLLIAEEEGMRNFQRARALFEIGLVREVAQSATQEKIQKLRVALKANYEALGNQPKFVETDIGFHLAIARVADNPIYLSLHSAVVQWLAEQRDISAIAGADQRTVYLEHCQIFEAIANGNPVAAQDAMQTHLEKVVENYWKARKTRKRTGEIKAAR